MAKYLVLVEETDWEYPNHTYITNETKSKMIGYFKRGTTEPVIFNKPLSFDTRYRKFKQIAKI